HGRVKTKTSAEEQAAKKKVKDKKAKVYRANLDKLFAKVLILRLAGDYDDEIISISGELLLVNPDITTVWNIRREALLKQNNELPDDEVQSVLQNELKFTEKFHTWDYRKIVVEHLKVPASAEFDYSTKKIMVNFSNYSSWHYRSRLLPCIYPHPSGSLPIREDKHKEDLVQNAAFTDPNDQSAWFYQRWLLGRTRQPLTIALAYISNQIACVVLTQNISISGDLQLILQVDADKVPVTWFSVSMKETLFENEKSCTTLSLYDGAQEVHSVSLERLASGDLKFGVKPQFSAGFSEGITSVLESELDSCMQLLDLEPDSK
ncbi:Geranylgeranyl transferase type-2 subunit alpha, partial [Blattella germanica]